MANEHSAMRLYVEWEGRADMDPRVEGGRRQMDALLHKYIELVVLGKRDRESWRQWHRR